MARRRRTLDGREAGHLPTARPARPEGGEGPAEPAAKPWEGLARICAQTVYSRRLPSHKTRQVRREPFGRFIRNCSGEPQSTTLGWVGR